MPAVLRTLCVYLLSSAAPPACTIAAGQQVMMSRCFHKTDVLRVGYAVTRGLLCTALSWVCHAPSFPVVARSRPVPV